MVGDEGKPVGAQGKLERYASDHVGKAADVVAVKIGDAGRAAAMARLMDLLRFPGSARRIAIKRSEERRVGKECRL